MFRGITLLALPMLAAWGRRGGAGGTGEALSRETFNEFQAELVGGSIVSDRQVALLAAAIARGRSKAEIIPQAEVYLAWLSESRQEEEAPEQQPEQQGISAQRSAPERSGSAARSHDEE